MANVPVVVFGADTVLVIVCKAMFVSVRVAGVEVAFKFATLIDLVVVLDRLIGEVSIFCVEILSSFVVCGGIFVIKFGVIVGGLVVGVFVVGVLAVVVLVRCVAADDFIFDVVGFDKDFVDFVGGCVDASAAAVVSPVVRAGVAVVVDVGSAVVVICRVFIGVVVFGSKNVVNFSAVISLVVNACGDCGCDDAGGVGVVIDSFFGDVGTVVLLVGVCNPPESSNIFFSHSPGSK